MSDFNDLDRAGIFEDTDAKAWREGADLLTELIEQAERDDTTMQENLVYESMGKAMDAGEPQLRSFCAVLGAYVASETPGACLDIAELKEIARRPVAQAVLP